MKLQGRKKASAAAPSVKTAPASPDKTGLRWKIFGIGIFLAAITFVVYGRTLQYGFVDYDDDLLVYENPIVAAGLTWNGISWAFSHYYAANWVPLTLVSHMLDCQFYQLDAGGHHLTNVLLHTASVVVLFFVLWQMTGALWRSAFVAAVFAVHPLHVESVAWVAERKDVLSGLFFMLALWAYVRYARQPESLLNYLLVLFLFALGLMSKPMLVTLPLILLLLDYWPLNRFSKQPAKATGWMKNFSIPTQLIIEKIPLLLLSLACCLLTVFAQKHEIIPLKLYPFSLRVDNALVSCVVYIWQMFHPANLAAFYPYPASVPVWESMGALVLLAVVSVAIVCWRRERPYLFVGWLWYLIMLAPVIGILQVGNQARADRYTYLPQIGLYVLLTWLAAEAGARLNRPRAILGAGAALILAAFVVNARAQTANWRDSEALWVHALGCTQNNSIAHNNFGNVLAQKGDLDDAYLHYQKAIEIDPEFEAAYNNLGFICFTKGQWDQAIANYQKALRLRPNNVKTLTNLGMAYAQKGESDEALACFQKARAIDPDYPDPREALHEAISEKGQNSAPVPPR